MTMEKAEDLSPGKQVESFSLPVRANIMILLVHPKLHWQNIFAIFMPVLVANQKCDWCQFYWLRGYLDVAMAVIYY